MFSHQKPGKKAIAFEVLRGMSAGVPGERGERYAQAEVPGSSLPSGQSQ